jgi:hypothetical protein
MVKIFERLLTKFRREIYARQSACASGSDPNPSG